MSPTALHIIELVKSLPAEEQRAVREALARTDAPKPILPRRQLQRLPDGSYYNPDGIPNDHPFFTIMEEIEAQRRDHPARPLPTFE